MYLNDYEHNDNLIIKIFIYVLGVLCKFADAAPDIYDRPNLQAILDCMTNNLSGAKPMVIQISAMRALYELCTDLSAASDEQRTMIIERLPAFLNFITDIATRAKGTILIDVLSTISAVASVRQHLTLNSNTQHQLICSNDFPSFF